MTTLTLIGEPEPFLHVTLAQNDKIYCESGAMVMMEDSLDLAGKMQGGMVQAFMRRFATGESLFMQEIVATRGTGDCLIAAPLDGGMQILDVGARQYKLADGAFVAATASVNVTAQMQNLGGALFGGTGGLMVMQSAGSGQLVVSGAGTLFDIDVTPQKDVIIDNGHVVAWDSTLLYEITTETKSGGGFLGNIVNSVTSGEGLVIRFRGAGKVTISSRNRNNTLSWLQSKLGGNDGDKFGFL